MRPKLADLAKPDRIVVVNEKKRLKLVALSFEIITYLLGEAPEQSWPLYNSWLRILVAATL